MNVLRKPFRYSFTNATLIIIGINVALFFLSGVIPLLKPLLSLRVPYIVEGKMYWQFFSYMFMHANVSHILFNMLGLFFFGLPLERSIGSKEFLLLYVLSGLGCGIVTFFVYLFSGLYYVTLLGASGAIYAVLLAFAVVFPRSNIYIWGLLPVPAPILIIVYAGIAVASQVFNVQDGVAHLTHFTGFVFAWFYFIIRMGVNPAKVWLNAYR